MTTRQKRLRTITAAFALLALLNGAASADAVLKYPKLWAYQWNQNPTRYFNCDYTSHLCERWSATRDLYGGVERVSEIIDDRDRTTVLAHIQCQIGNGDERQTCVNFDTGEAKLWNRNVLFQTGRINIEDKYRNMSATIRFNNVLCSWFKSQDGIQAWTKQDLVMRAACSNE
jgi:hypothetical protein